MAVKMMTASSRIFHTTMAARIASAMIRIQPSQVHKLRPLRWPRRCLRERRPGDGDEQAPGGIRDDRQDYRKRDADQQRQEPVVGNNASASGTRRLLRRWQHDPEDPITEECAQQAEHDHQETSEKRTHSTSNQNENGDHGAGMDQHLTHQVQLYHMSRAVVKHNRACSVQIAAQGLHHAAARQSVDCRAAT